MATFLMVFIWILFGALNAWYANYKGRDPFIWFFLGILLGIVGLVILYFLPDLSANTAVNNDHPEPSPDKPMVELLPATPKILQPEQKEWYYLDRKNNQQGPVGIAAMTEEWHKGEIDQETYVWCESLDQWYRIKELPNLLNELYK